MTGIKHGIYAKCVVLGNEDHDAWTLALDGTVAAWQPADDRELRLATDIANANWRIDRLSAYEVAGLDFEIDRMRPDIDATFEEIDEITRSTLAFNSLLVNNKILQQVQTALRTQFRLRDRAITLLLRLQKERKTEARHAAADTSDSTSPIRTAISSDAEPSPGTAAAILGFADPDPAIAHEQQHDAPVPGPSVAPDPTKTTPADPAQAPAAAPSTTTPATASTKPGAANVVNIENRRSEPKNAPQTGSKSWPAHAPAPAHGPETRRPS